MRLHELQILASPSLETIKEAIGGVGGQKAFQIDNGEFIFDRYVFRTGGKRIGVDYHDDVFLGIYEINESYYKISGASLNEALFGLEKKQQPVKAPPTTKQPVNFPPQQSQSDVREAPKKIGLPGASEETTPEPETAEDAVSKERKVVKRQYGKDMMTGSEMFKRAERRIKGFLRGQTGSDNKNIFVLYGMPGVGKSVSARNALNSECGAEITGQRQYEMLAATTYTEQDFGKRIKTYDIAREAKELYQNYLEAYGMKDQSGRLFVEDSKMKALRSVQRDLGKQLYGYELTLEDLEGTGGNLSKLGSHKQAGETAGDVVAKIKSFTDVKPTENKLITQGWIEAPSELSSEDDLYLLLLIGRSRAIFVDEGDSYLRSNSQMMKKAFANGNRPRLVDAPKSKNTGYITIEGRIAPDKFWCMSRMIITTNDPPSKWDGAIRSRSIAEPFYLSTDQVFERLYDILPELHKRELPHLPKRILDLVVEGLRKQEKAKNLHALDFREFVTLCNEFAMILEEKIKEANVNFPLTRDTSDEQIDRWIGVAGQDDPQVMKWREQKRREMERESSPERRKEIAKNFEREISKYRLEVRGKSPGGAIWDAAWKEFKRVLAHSIQQMNRASLSDPNVVALPEEGEDAA